LADHPGIVTINERNDCRQAGAKVPSIQPTLELILRGAGVENLVSTGITTDVCVLTTMREANDRGFECLLLSGSCGATDLGNHQAAIKMIKMQGGVFGAVSDSGTFVKAINN
jgi:biuret amidohydrolase